MAKGKWERGYVGEQIQVYEGELPENWEQMEDWEKDDYVLDNWDHVKDVFEDLGDYVDCRQVFDDGN